MLINESKFVGNFKQRIEATKRVSKANDLEETLERIYYTLQYFNTLPEFTMTLGSRPLSEIVIADEWKDFIIPESVRLDPTDLKTNNLVVRPSKEDLNVSAEKEILSDYIDNLKKGFTPEIYYTFINDQLRVRSYFKTDLTNNTTNLATLRANKCLMDIIPIMAVKDGDGFKCRSLDEPYIPVELCSSLNCLFRSDYYNVEMDNMFYDYMSKKVIG